MAEVLNFVTVLLVAVVVASSISVLYATGLRLWAKSCVVDVHGRESITNRLFSVVCFALCVVIVLFALWLMIPQFH